MSSSCEDSSAVGSSPAEPLYLIEASDSLARFRISRHRATEGIMVSLHDGRATLSFSASDAKALGRALIAVAEYGFEIAETLTAIRLREEAIARRAAISSTHREPTRPPSLDDL